jgi:iron complex outermembrane recepter protein
VTSDLSIFAGYSTGFDANDVIGRTTLRAGQSFEPEFFEQFEAGIKTKQFFGVTATLSGFVLNRKNLLLPDPLDSSFSVQVGAQRTQGFEADVLINPLEGLNIRLGYAFLDSEVTEDANLAQIGRLQPNTPRHTLNGFASYLIGSGVLKNLQLGAGFVFVDKVFASLSNLNERPSFATAQFNLAYTLGRIRFDATLANAFDERFFIPRNENTVSPGEPRQFTLRASVAF